MQYFEQSQGQLVLREGPNISDCSSPFCVIANQTLTHRPIMADWNGDGNMDMLLLAKVFDRRSNLDGSDIAQSQCTSYLYEQHKIGGKTTLVFKDEPFFRNEGCSSFDGSGASFVDVDGDGDLDAIFGSHDGPLHVYNRTSAGLVKSNEFPSNSTPLDMIHFKKSLRLPWFDTQNKFPPPSPCGLGLGWWPWPCFASSTGFQTPWRESLLSSSARQHSHRAERAAKQLVPDRLGQAFQRGWFWWRWKGRPCGFRRTCGLWLCWRCCLSSDFFWLCSGRAWEDPFQLSSPLFAMLDKSLLLLAWWHSRFPVLPWLEWRWGHGRPQKGSGREGLHVCFHAKQKSKHKAIHFLNTYAAILYRCFHWYVPTRFAHVGCAKSDTCFAHPFFPKQCCGSYRSG